MYLGNEGSCVNLDNSWLSSYPDRNSSNIILWVPWWNSFYWTRGNSRYCILYDKRWTKNRCMEIYEWYDFYDRWSVYRVSTIKDFPIMNLLQIFFIISGLVIFLVALDIAKRERFNALHFLVFLGVGGGLLVLTLVPEILVWIGKIFWLQRGADALVYGSIIFLFYFVLLLLRKTEANREELTRIVREFAIQSSHEKK